MPKDQVSTVSPNARQVGGNHYKDSTGKCPHCHGEVQHWDWGGSLPGLEYAATKYIARHRSKRGKEDLEKAIHYIQKVIERDYPEQLTLGLEDVETNIKMSQEQFAAFHAYLDAPKEVNENLSKLLNGDPGDIVSQYDVQPTTPGAAIHAVLETLDPPVSQPLFLAPEAMQFIESQEYQDAVEAYAARQRADAYARETHTGLTAWQKRHPESVDNHGV